MRYFLFDAGAQVGIMLDVFRRQFNFRHEKFVQRNVFPCPLVVANDMMHCAGIDVQDCRRAALPLDGSDLRHEFGGFVLAAAVCQSL